VHPLVALESVENDPESGDSQLKARSPAPAAPTVPKRVAPTTPGSSMSATSPEAPLPPNTVITELAVHTLGLQLIPTGWPFETVRP
jgi:hypothetical protein